MGSVLSGVGNFFGSTLGSVGGGVAQGAGAIDQFQGNNPYDRSYLEQQVNQQGQIYGQQQNLAQALQAQMAGQGPNPAQTQYLANTQNNIANAQGMIASQRGLNPALAARMGVNASSNANQQATLGSGLMQAEQQLAAQKQYGDVLGQMQQGNLNYQNLYNQGFYNQQGYAANTAAQNAATRGQLAGTLIMPLGNSATSAATSGAKKSGADGAAGGGGNVLSMTETSGAGSAASDAAALSKGGVVKGKAKVSGNSYSNDTVPTMLSPGEIVIPRSNSHDPEKAKEFIDHLLKNPEKKKIGYGDVLKARRKRAA